MNERSNSNAVRADSTWRFDGTLWEFVETVQWVLVLRQLKKADRPDIAEIVVSPEKIEAAAEEYGITMRATVNEMLRISKDALNMYRAIDAQQKD